MFIKSLVVATLLVGVVASPSSAKDATTIHKGVTTCRSDGTIVGRVIVEDGGPSRVFRNGVEIPTEDDADLLSHFSDSTWVRDDYRVMRFRTGTDYTLIVNVTFVQNGEKITRQFDWSKSDCGRR